MKEMPDSLIHKQYVGQVINAIIVTRMAVWVRNMPNTHFSRLAFISARSRCNSDWSCSISLWMRAISCLVARLFSITSAKICAWTSAWSSAIPTDLSRFEMDNVSIMDPCMTFKHTHILPFSQPGIVHQAFLYVHTDCSKIHDIVSRW